VVTLKVTVSRRTDPPARYTVDLYVTNVTTGHVDRIPRFKTLDVW